MKKEYKHRKKGYVALTTVLVLVPMLLLIGITLIVNNIDLLITSHSLYEHKTLELKAITCQEEALFRIKDNISFTGANSITINGSTCTYTVTDGSSSGLKEILIDINNGEYHYSKEKTVDTNQNPFMITN